MRQDTSTYFSGLVPLVWAPLVPAYCCPGATETPQSRLEMQYQKIFSDSLFECSIPASFLFGSELMDRRHHKRFDLQATALFSWRDSGGVRWQGKGRTRDISEMGVFVETPDCPPSGAAVRLEVRASALAASGLMMHTRGQVVRVEITEQPQAAAGFAAATRSLKLRNCKPVVTGRAAEYQPGPRMNSKSWSSHSRKPN